MKIKFIVYHNVGYKTLFCKLKSWLLLSTPQKALILMKVKYMLLFTRNFFFLPTNDKL